MVLSLEAKVVELGWSCVPDDRRPLRWHLSRPSSSTRSRFCFRARLQNGAILKLGEGHFGVRPTPEGLRAGIRCTVHLRHERPARCQSISVEVIFLEEAIFVLGLVFKTVPFWSFKKTYKTAPFWSGQFWFPCPKQCRFKEGNFVKKRHVRGTWIEFR